MYLAESQTHNKDSVNGGSSSVADFCLSLIAYRLG